MKNIDLKKIFLIVFCIPMLYSCNSIDGALLAVEQDYSSSCKPEIVRHRSNHYVNYRVGDVFVSNRVLFWSDGMTGRCVTRAYSSGETIKEIPPGTRFSITAIKAEFSATCTSVSPYFSVEGIPEKNIGVIPFVEIKRQNSNLYVSYLYNKEYFRRIGSLE